MSFDVLAAAQQRRYSQNYRSAAWLAAESEALISSGEWAELGGLMLHVALAAAPIGGLPARLAAASDQPPRSAGSAWGDAAWVAAEVRLHVAALLDVLPGGATQTVQGVALRAAGALARVAL
jgi:hypothetical protein